MGHLSTHVLDTMNGCPAAGMAVKLQRIDGDRVDQSVTIGTVEEWTIHNRKLGEFILRDIPPMPAGLPKIDIQFILNADGRNDGGALLDAQSMATGRYRLVFSVAPYFRALGVALPQPPFIDDVPIDFGIADAAGRYHVPLLVSPWAYSTYRGS